MNFWPHQRAFGRVITDGRADGRAGGRAGGQAGGRVEGNGDERTNLSSS